GGAAFRAQEESDAEQLVASLGLLCERLEGRVEVEVFFDGAFRPLAARGPGLRVRFSREEDADLLILDRVRAACHEHSGGVTVVTGDGELGRKAAEEGAGWLRLRPGQGVERLLGAIEGRWKC
ncbi:MAG: hypothetical protein KGK30_09380, partial [Elusimicrobia bacterium]|nr:hypothetical protein [Elusimicrobiota bacterium]